MFREASAGLRGPSRHDGRTTPLYVIASPQPATGKTFLARLVVDFLQLNGHLTRAYDLNDDGSSLTEFQPRLTVKAEIGRVQGQMALFDQVVANDGVAKVIDVGAAEFEHFFDVADQIGFVEETRRHSVELITLYAADPHPASAPAYARLQLKFPDMVLVPVFNEAIVKGRRPRLQFPFGRAAAVPLQIPQLSASARAQLDRCSFAHFHNVAPGDVPPADAAELKSFVKRTFLEFRELELRLLLEKLRASLKT
jgi:hypothetical protein